MASDTTIAAVLAFLQELFPSREITEKTLPSWALYFAEWSDHEFTTCAHRTAKEPGRKFFPTPGEIAAHRRPSRAIDTDALLERIARLGSHNVSTGWIYPSADRIRESLGDAIADAYVNAGASQCFASADSSGATISRDIARRRFADAIDAANLATPGGLRLPPPEPALLSPPIPPEPTGPIPTQIPAGPLAPALSAMTGLPIAESAPIDPDKIPPRPTITAFCDGCKKLTKVSRYPNPFGGVSWLCQEACAPKPQEIMRTIVEHSPPPPDAVPNPAIDQWLEPVPPPDLDVPHELVDLEIDENLAIDQHIADEEREGATS